MALPTFKAAGVFTAGTGTITPPYPVAPNAPVANDIAILVCESENEAISLTTANGFAELGLQANKAAGTAATDPASRLAVYWKRCVGGDAAPLVADSGNHTTGQIYLFSGCVASGDPWNVYAEGNDGGVNDTSGVIPGATTTVADCLIFIICTSSYNSTQTTEFSAWTNANLANILERGDNTNTAGLGGGHGSATGEKAAAGTYGNTTVTLAHTSYKGAMSIALKPPPAITGTGAEQARAVTLAGAGGETFTGSGAVSAIRALLAATGEQAFIATGAFASARAALAGVGTYVPPAVTGEGAVLIPAALLVASGGQTFAASGALTALVAQLSGSGAEAFAGSGALLGRSAALAGAGAQAFEGAVALSAKPAVLAAAGGQSFAGAGALSAAKAAVAGAAALSFEGAVALTAPPMGLAATGVLAFAGAGALSAAKASLTGVGTVETGTGVSGTAAFLAPAAGLAGIGLVAARSLSPHMVHVPLRAVALELVGTASENGNGAGGGGA